MANWAVLVENFFAKSNPDKELVRISPSGCCETEISKIESRIGFTLPGELREFYQHFNGIGLGRDVGDKPRFIPPIESLQQFVDSARSSFTETHSEVAERYLPFIDWGNGDSSGYLVDADGDLCEYVLIFSHEHYLRDKEQDVDEFLTPFAKSLEDMLGW